MTAAANQVTARNKLKRWSQKLVKQDKITILLLMHLTQLDTPQKAKLQEQ